MKNLKKTILSMLGLTVLVTACADAPLAPSMDDVPLAVAFGKGGPKGGGNDGTSKNPNKLMWLNSVNGAPTYSATCTATDDCLISGERGLSVSIPAGALSETTEITVTLVNGSTVDLDFQPHGTVFNMPIKVALHASETNAANVRGKFYAMYWNSDPNSVEEVFEAYKKSGYFYFFPEHFSGYALGM
jgi:hypothetical protein